MTTPCIITVAITGSLPTKRDNPAVPISISEQIESTQAAFEAGATLAHCHVRNDDGTPTSDPERFGRLLEGLRRHCPGMIVQLSTGGRSGAGRERGGIIPFKPDMCSLSTGSCNFPTRVYENSPDLVDWLASEMLTYGVKPEIEAFDLSMIFKAVEMAKAGQIKGPLHVQFVMGARNAMPVDRASFEFYVATLNLSLNRIRLALKLVATNPGRRTLTFHEDIEACNLIHSVLAENGVKAGVYHSKMTLRARAVMLGQYRRGEIDVLVTCRALDEEFNVPETELGIIAASTATRRQRIQRLGRVVRPAKAKRVL
jgi:HAMP domain-containing protein